MKDYPKPIKKRLTALADQAYERELARELTQLAARFDDWRAGRITPWELNDQIHRYHNGPAWELFKFYDYGGSPQFAVARAVAEGVLKEKEIPAEVWPYIQEMVQFCRDQTGDQNT